MKRVLSVKVSANIKVKLAAHKGQGHKFKKQRSHSPAIATPSTAAPMDVSHGSPSSVVTAPLQCFRL